MMKHDRELQEFERRQRLSAARDEDHASTMWDALKRAFGSRPERMETELERKLPSRQPGAWPL